MVAAQSHWLDPRWPSQYYHPGNVDNKLGIPDGDLCYLVICALSPRIIRRTFADQVVVVYRWRICSALYPVACLARYFTCLWHGCSQRDLISVGYAVSCCYRYRHLALSIVRYRCHYQSYTCVWFSYHIGDWLV